MRRLAICCAFLFLGCATAARAAEYEIDPAHSAFTFKIRHLGVSWTYGRFTKLDGAFRMGDDPLTDGFALNIEADSIDTGNQQRDADLRGPDWFDAQKFPLITFKSVAVKAVDGGYEVTGDLSMHGVRKTVVFTLEGGETAEFPAGVERIGFTTNVILKRSDFGMKTMVGPVADDVYLAISFEGIKRPEETEEQEGDQP